MVTVGVVAHFQIIISIALLTISWTRSRPRSIQGRFGWHARHVRFMLVLHALFSRGLHMVTWITRISHVRQGTIPFRLVPLASSLVSAVLSLSRTLFKRQCRACILGSAAITARSGILYPAAVLPLDKVLQDRTTKHTLLQHHHITDLRSSSSEFFPLWRFICLRYHGPGFSSAGPLPLLTMS